MDIARTASRRKFCFFRDNGTQITAHWYRCPEGAKVFPTQHKWGHLDWYSYPWDATGVGEVFDAPQTYSTGATPPGVTGQSYFGALEDFQLGAKWNPLNVTPRRGDGIAFACNACDQQGIAMEAGICNFVLDEDGEPIQLED